MSYERAEVLFDDRPGRERRCETAVSQFGGCVGPKIRRTVKPISQRLYVAQTFFSMRVALLVEQ